MSNTVPAQQITALIPTVDSGNIAVRVVSPDGTVGYLVGKEAFSHQSSTLLRQYMIKRDETSSITSESDMLAGAIATSMMVFGEAELVGFTGATVNVMTGESIIGKPARYAVLCEDEEDGHTELVAVISAEELGDKYQEDEYSIFNLDSLRYQYAWNLKTDEPYTDDPHCNGKKYLLPL